ncbi:SCP2 sterol-binding domain-containing protein [Micromonospora sp. A3M-1-15]|uniref:SCP2 sterol-binding domain-containing protein n=1 Tax=Micromonospora sp. A3M-1-15 TaxID=2962035 RepID=UPI0020B881BF|nr:SCP2 sterol-binding domain-containing protein [Micromonospora sp. A3M-1-15]MCP3785707.1 SCP2 sterol-binding domain-containing protein [Micromonospora sp. A3M-1-15]
MLLVIRREIRGGGGAMSEVTRRFFDELERHGHERVLRKTSGTLRFDLEHDDEIDHWLVEIRGGGVRVSQQNSDADAVIRSDNAFFERMVRGEAKPLPAWLRNDITSEGKFRFVVLLERLFAPPPGSRHPRVAARQGGGRR